MEGQAAHHLSRVLRAQTGQLYELSDGEQVWVGRIERVGRVRVPALGELAKAESIFGASKNGLRVMLSERAIATPLRSILEGQRTTTVIIAVGPEGGWTDKEFDAARSCGFLEASLGRLILRTETAVVAALASLNYALDRE